jgi:ApbE superfamily uncharacterized protein (UPF0280 family)
MWQSVRAVGDEDLTPMAAVAGTVADGVADFLFARGATKAIVDNGGDVAIRLSGFESARVGLRPDLARERISHVLRLDGSQSAWGVATSGLGGRSLTRGIASAVTVVAGRASMADAAATAIANATLVLSTAVRQVRAGELDPDSDIADLPVTVEVRDLEEKLVARALEQAMRRAEELVAREVIQGAFASVQGTYRMTGSLAGRIEDAS